MALCTFASVRAFARIKGDRPEVRFALVVMLLETTTMAVHMNAVGFFALTIDLYQLMNMGNVLVKHRAAHRLNDRPDQETDDEYPHSSCAHESNHGGIIVLDCPLIKPIGTEGRSIGRIVRSTLELYSENRI